MGNRTDYIFENSKSDDIETALFFFRSAIAYQRAKGYEMWPEFTSELIEKEIKENRHFKIIHNKEIVCVLSVQYNDPVIWKEKDIDPAIYLHRIAVNPNHKGNRMMERIRDWAIEHAKKNGKKFVRMDTWGNNLKIRDYYISCGFIYIGQQQLSSMENDPLHYGGNNLSLFELSVEV